MKPFKPLTIRKESAASTTAQDFAVPTPKRRRLSPDEDSSSKQHEPPSVTRPNPAVAREPLKPLGNPRSPPKSVDAPSNDNASHYTVLWRLPTAKKNKSWTGDGVLSVSNGFATFCDSSGKVLGRSAFSRPLLPGSNLMISGKEIEIDSPISRAEFLAVVQPISQSAAAKSSTKASKTETDKKNVKAELRQTGSLKSQLKAAIKRETDAKASLQPVQAAYKPLLKGSGSRLATTNDVPTPRHDPNAPGAVVFKRLNEMPAGKQVVDVVLDPALGNRLYPHQIEGVKFMYECVMGLRKEVNGQGCILADDMGLGKTAQTVALLWTLIKQNPIYKASPVVKKALVVCPVSVIQNWRKELRKWLGHTNIGVLLFDNPKTTSLRNFDGKVYNIMIIGYERLRMVADELADSHDIDIVICDEGHRLKTEKNKSAKAIQSLNTSRRVILSGTPIQNDLSEFFCMASFVNDGCLGTAKAFAKDFETPILRSRQPHATDDALEKGQLAAEELARTTSPFILRRTAEILANILPTKTEFVLFCKPTAEQAEVYKSVITSPMFSSATLDNHEGALQMITILKKLCNSPALLKPKATTEGKTSNSLQTLNEMLDGNMRRYFQNSLSAKIRLLDVLLQQIRKTTDEKVVLVSHYTSTLDLMANLLENSNFKYLRLDGSVSSAKRQSLVDQFNRSPASSSFAFLLSAKAGGVGINLIGGSRLILFDVDWNPATDDQAIARIHRQGQKRPTYIYRFLLKGCIEEKIWQRQLVKRGLAENIMEGGGLDGKSTKGKGAAFTQEELRDLFRYDDAEGLRTHDLIHCDCEGGRRSPDAQGDVSDVEIQSDEVGLPGEQTVELPEVEEIIAASQLSLEADGTISPPKSSAINERSDVDEQELMKYSHIDTNDVSSYGEDSDELEKIHLMVDDRCLTHVLRQDEDTVASSVAYIFKRVWGSKLCAKEHIR